MSQFRGEVTEFFSNSKSPARQKRYCLTSLNINNFSDGPNNHLT